MICYDPPRYTLVPWLIEQSDLCPAPVQVINDTYPDRTFELTVHGRTVYGQAPCGTAPVLGMIEIRSLRLFGDKVRPSWMTILDTPPTPPEPRPARKLRLRYDEDGA